jgi:beta-mannosidase
VGRLTDAASGAVLAEAFHFPLGRALAVTELGMEARVEEDGQGWLLELATSRLAQSVHIEDAHFRGEEEWFHLAPGAPRRLRLVPRDDAGASPDGAVHALNGASPVRFRP